MKKAGTRGASREQGIGFKLPQVRWTYHLSVLALMSLVVVIVIFGREPLIELVDKPVANIQVEGEFYYVGEAEVSKLVAPLIDRSFLQLRLEKIKQEVEAQPWVSSVVLTRRWPDQLRVQVYEQNPIARWGNDSYLSAHGDVIVAKDAAKKLAKFPLLTGPKDSAQLVMKSFKRLNQLLAQHDLQVSMLAANDRLAWKMTLTNGWQVKLGRDEVIEKVQRLMGIYERTLKNKAGQIKAVDLRYENGFSVTWKDDANILASVQ